MTPREKNFLMTGDEFRKTRMMAGIPGDLVCQRARLSRTKLCGFERGYLSLPPHELDRAETALHDLAEVKRKLCTVAAEYGWPVSAI